MEQQKSQLQQVSEWTFLCTTCYPECSNTVPLSTTENSECHTLLVDVRAYAMGATGEGRGEEGRRVEKNV